MTDLVFGAPRYLALLVVPAALGLLWVWTFVRRRIELGRLRRHRIVPVRERFGIGGELFFWVFQIVALALIVAALARPQASTSIPRRAGLDIVVLQDASASMRVADVGRNLVASTNDAAAVAGERSAGGAPRVNRWQRSMQFLRELGDALSWHEDRLAMTVFAHIAAPQIRLTRDPNTLFFFLDHLSERPPFRLEDDTTWDTNLELGMAWGMRMVEKDEEIHGRSQNAALFVVLTDGESWSGEVAKAILLANQRGIPVHVIGVGSLGGGPLPAMPRAPDEDPEVPEVSRLERAALQRIAAAGHGQYFELDRDGDRYIANTIVAAGRRLAPSLGLEQTAAELYWWFLCAGGAAGAIGALFLRRPVELGILLAAGLVSAVTIGPLLF